MKRIGALLGSMLAWGLATGCFSDPTEDQTCNPGMEGCACVDLQCEQGLMCMGGVCVAGGGSTTGDGTTTNPITTTSTTVDPTMSGDSSTSGEPTTGDADSSSSGEPAESSSSTGGGDVCGDFVVGPTEECDGGNGCSSECELEVHECNPLNNVPCPSGFKCSWELLMADPFTGYFTCLPLADAPLGDGQGECFVMDESQDQLCELGLACFNSNFLEGCESGGCCTEYCDVMDSVCGNPAYTCVAEPDLAPGLPNLGVCRPG